MVTVLFLFLTELISILLSMIRLKPALCASAHQSSCHNLTVNHSCWLKRSKHKKILKNFQLYQYPSRDTKIVLKSMYPKQTLMVYTIVLSKEWKALLARVWLKNVSLKSVQRRRQKMFLQEWHWRLWQACTTATRQSLTSLEKGVNNYISRI